MDLKIFFYGSGIGMIIVIYIASNIWDKKFNKKDEKSKVNRDSNK